MKYAKKYGAIKANAIHYIELALSHFKSQHDTTALHVHAQRNTQFIGLSEALAGAWINKTDDETVWVQLSFDKDVMTGDKVDVDSAEEAVELSKANECVVLGVPKSNVDLVLSELEKRGVRMKAEVNLTNKGDLE